MERTTAAFNVEGIISVAGKSELLKMLAKSRTGLIAEGLSTAKRFPISAHQSVSALSEIAIYALDREVPLKEVFAAMFNKYEGQQAPSVKNLDNHDLRADFETILPDFDQERVYISDIKKVYSWYNQLVAAGLGLEESKTEADAAETEENAQ
jgi:hypothetical protein